MASPRDELILAIHEAIQAPLQRIGGGFEADHVKTGRPWVARAIGRPAREQLGERDVAMLMEPVVSPVGMVVRAVRALNNSRTPLSAHWITRDMINTGLNDVAAACKVRCKNSDKRMDEYITSSLRIGRGLPYAKVPNGGRARFTNADKVGYAQWRFNTHAAVAHVAKIMKVNVTMRMVKKCLALAREAA